MRSIEEIIVENAEASGISVEENLQLARAGQCIRWNPDEIVGTRIRAETDTSRRNDMLHWGLVVPVIQPHQTTQFKEKSQ